MANETAQKQEASSISSIEKNYTASNIEDSIVEKTKNFTYPNDNSTPWAVTADNDSWLFAGGHTVIKYHLHSAGGLGGWGDWDELYKNAYVTGSLKLLKEQGDFCKKNFLEKISEWNIDVVNRKTGEPRDRTITVKYDYDIKNLQVPDSIAPLDTEDSHFNEKIKNSYISLISLLKDRINVINSYPASIDTDMETVDDAIYHYFTEAYKWNNTLLHAIKPNGSMRLTRKEKNHFMPWLDTWFSNNECIQKELRSDIYIGNDAMLGIYPSDKVFVNDTCHDKTMIFPDSIQNKDKGSYFNASTKPNAGDDINFDSVCTIGLVKSTFNPKCATNVKDNQVVLPIAKACLYVVFNGLYCDDADNVCVLTSNRDDVRNYIATRGYPGDPWVDIKKQLDSLENMLKNIVNVLHGSEIKGRSLKQLSHVFTTTTPGILGGPEDTSGAKPGHGPGKQQGGLTREQIEQLIASRSGGQHGISKEDMEKLVNEKLKAQHLSDSQLQNRQNGQPFNGGMGQIPNISPSGLNPSGLNPSLTVPGGGNHNPVAPTSAHEHDPDAKHHHHKHDHKNVDHKKNLDYDIISNPKPDHHDQTKVDDQFIPPDNHDHVDHHNDGGVEVKTPPNLNGARDTVMIHGVKCHFSDTDLGGSQSGAKAALMATHYGEPLNNGLHTTMQDAAHKAGFTYDTTPGHLPGEKVNSLANVVPGNILHTSAKDYLVVAKDGNSMHLLDSTGKIVDLSKIHIDPRDSEFAFCKLANDNQPYPQGTPFGKNMDPDTPAMHAQHDHHGSTAHTPPAHNNNTSGHGSPTPGKPQARPSVNNLMTPPSAQGKK